MPQFTRSDDDSAARGTLGTRSIKQVIGDSVAVRTRRLSDGRNPGIVYTFRPDSVQTMDSAFCAASRMHHFESERIAARTAAHQTRRESTTQ
jgi:hypothetical protein